MPQAAADMGGGLRASRLEDSARPLSEEEILSAYDRAVLIYGWFELEPLPNNGHTTWVDGTVYRQVEADGLEDLEALRRTSFCQSAETRPATGISTGISTSPGPVGARTPARAAPSSRWSRPPTPPILSM